MNPRRDVEIVGRRLELTDAIRLKAEEVAAKLYEHDAGLERIRIEVELERHSATHQGEFIAKGILDDRREHFMASSTGDDLYAVLGDLEKKLDRLVRRSSRRRVTDRKHPRGIELNAQIPKVGDPAA